MDCHSICKKCGKRYYGVFESEEECKVWAKRINALHKLRLIANNLNEVLDSFASGHRNGKGECAVIETVYVKRVRTSDI